MSDPARITAEDVVQDDAIIVVGDPEPCHDCGGLEAHDPRCHVDEDDPPGDGTRWPL